MAADYITKDQESECRQTVEEGITKEANSLIGKGFDPDYAQKYAEELYVRRQQAVTDGHVIVDDNGDVQSFIEEELNNPGQNSENLQTETGAGEW